MSTVTNDEAREIIAENLRRLLIEWGWTQGDLARALFDNVSVAERMKVSRWCSGAVLPSAAELYNIAAVAECPVDDLLKKNLVTS